MDTGIIIIILSLGIPAGVIVFFILFIKRQFKRNKKFADELKKNLAEAKPATAKVITASQGVEVEPLKD